MKEKISILIITLLLAVNLFGCGKTADSGKDKDIKDLSRPAHSSGASEEAQTKEDDKEVLPEEVDETDVALKDVRQKILDKCEITDSMFVETEGLPRLYNIDAGKVKQSASFVTMSGTFPHEVIMIEAVDDSAAEEIVSLLENRLSEVKIQSQSYDAKNYALALECKVVKNGNFLSLFLSPDHKEITSVYNEYIK